MAPPWLPNQAVSSAILPAPSHSTVRSEATISMEGSVVSSTVIDAVVTENKPQLSVAVKVTTTVPDAPQAVFSEPAE